MILIKNGIRIRPDQKVPDPDSQQCTCAYFCTFHSLHASWDQFLQLLCRPLGPTVRPFLESIFKPFNAFLFPLFIIRATLCCLTYSLSILYIHTRISKTTNIMRRSGRGLTRKSCRFKQLSSQPPIQRHCTENSKQILPEMKLQGHIPNFQIVPLVSLCSTCQREKV
jgi:hypothetical protein